MNKLKTSSKSSKPHLNLIYGVHGLFLITLVLLFTALFTACDDSAKDNKSSNNNITEFVFKNTDNPALSTDLTASVSNNTIIAAGFFGINREALTPTITINDGASIDPASGKQQDFTGSVNYTVTAENGVTKVHIVTVSEGDPPKLDQWTQIRKPKKILTARYGHSTVVLSTNDVQEMFIIGGRTIHGGIVNDVWKSKDGSTWTEVIAADTKFSARQYHSSVVLKNAIYVIGGFADTKKNDVWKSSDGITWIEVAKPTTSTDRFSARNSHTSVVLGNTIYVIGGDDGSKKNDVWKSSDGITWTEVTNSTTGAAFSARARHTSVALGADIYVIGGYDGTNRLNDVWKSSDGKGWTEVSTTTGDKFSARLAPTSVVLGNTIYVIGGDDGTNRLNDVWKSSDAGSTWEELTKNTDDTNKFKGRSLHTSVVLTGKLFVIDGIDLLNVGLNNVWKSDNGVSWTSILDTEPDTTLFSKRENHNTVVLDNSMFVIGGYNGSNYLNDVWKSSDGITWIEVAKPTTSTDRFSARNSHTSVVLDNYIYVIGGYDGSTKKNDVWKSSDGITWIEVAKPTTSTDRFSARSGHTSVVLDNTIYVIGGYDGAKKNDVWKSSNGSAWTELTLNITTPRFSVRSGHTSVVLKNIIYVIGGDIGETTGSNDVWKSSNGSTWTEVTANAEFTARYVHTSVALDNALFVIAGDSESGRFNDVWKSSNGSTWTEITKGTDDAKRFPVRSKHTSVLLNGKVYVIGGTSASGTTQLNDVWSTK